ncbi:MAG: hypothetical protein LBV43_08595 [Prevotella sp.]|jgi:hypothetical protein|nr:hypothetical protein [Prevotella sp.]
MKSKILLVIFTYLAICQSIKSQVTIGLSAEPDNSTLLDLKTNPDGTSNKGILLPRVALINTETFGLDGNSGTAGILIYNTHANVTGANAKGIGYYYWDGAS